MKVKNIAFSGFAAAVLAGVCGVADAATVQIASPTYVDNAVKAVADAKQDKLIQGTGITIENNVISADMSEATITNADGTETTVADALAEKQDALENADVLESITAEDVAAIENNTTNITNLTQTVDGNTTNISNLNTTVENLTTTVEGKQEKLKAGDNITIDETTNTISANVDLSGYATTESLGAYATDQELADAKTELQTSIDKLTAGDVELTNYYTKTETDNALSAKASTETVNAIDARVTTAEGEIDALQAATANLDSFVDSTEIANYSTTEQMNAAIEANKYDDSALAARVTDNENNIKTNTDDITAIKDAKYVSSAGQSAGKYLMQVADDGSVSWLDVQIVDAPESGQ